MKRARWLNLRRTGALGATCLLTFAFLVIRTERVSCGGSLYKATDSTGTKTEVKINTLVQAPQEYCGKSVIVHGVLKNIGKSYFGDFRLYIFDEEGRRFPVNPWRPLSLPPPRNTPRGKRPAVMSDFLDKKLRLEGKIMENTDKRRGEKYTLVVSSAEPDSTR